MARLAMTTHGWRRRGSGASSLTSVDESEAAIAGRRRGAAARLRSLGGGAAGDARPAACSGGNFEWGLRAAERMKRQS
eukprot:4461901-Heterocapsa_arctica.AAC.1